MNEELEESAWPEEAGDVNDLPREMPPPPGLEDRVAGTLLERGLIGLGSRAKRSGGRGRGLLTAAAALLLVATGFIAGRWVPGGATEARAPEGATAGDATSKYALLLYETEAYRAAAGVELLTRYQEYGAWVAEARGRGQFVTGEDFAVDDGRVISPVFGGGGGGRAANVAPGVRPEASAPLSGVFVITARDYAHAVELAERLPHLAHGGQVVVQEVVPTEEPPRIEPG